MFWIELNPSWDEYAGSDTWGIKLGTFCLLGVTFWRACNRQGWWKNRGGSGWRFGLVVCNIGFGVWSDGGK